MAVIGDTILIVDDSADDRFLTARALERIAPGIIIRYAESGKDAIAYLDGDGGYADRIHFPYPAFVITDRAMRPGDGFSVLDALQKAAPAGRVPVMMLSSSADPVDVRHAYGLGAHSYCLKRADDASLCATLLAFLNGHVSSQIEYDHPGGSLSCA